MPAFQPTTHLPFLPQGMTLWVPEGGNPDLIQSMFMTADMFIRMCSILTIDDKVERCVPSASQTVVLLASHEHRNVWVDKYRQAFITTLFDLLMLRDIMYGEGLNGAIVAQKEETHKEHMRRIAFAYTTLANNPDTAALVVPLKAGTKATTSGIEFEHGGGIWPITAGSDSPGVGRSFSRVLETEACEMSDEDYRRLNTKFYPTIDKRPNGRIWRESTPGRRNSPMFRGWSGACTGNSGFFPVFLAWWLDPRNALPPGVNMGPIESDEEKGLIEKMPGISRGHIYFRRRDIMDRCDGDPMEFEKKYPSSPFDGWATDGNAHINPLLLQRLLSEGVGDPPEDDCGARIITPSNPRRHYLLAADPADFGKKGDPSAFTIWDLTTFEEVAFWEGREQPDLFHTRCKKAAIHYNDALLMYESNCSAVIGIAYTDDDEDLPELYYDQSDKPGWRATTKSLQEAEGSLNIMLRDGSLTIKAKSTVLQLLLFDGLPRDRRIRKDNGEQSHGDRARTVVMAARFMEQGGYMPEITLEELAALRAEKALQAQIAKDAAYRRQLAAFGIRPPGGGASDNPWAPGAGRNGL